MKARVLQASSFITLVLGVTLHCSAASAALVVTLLCFYIAMSSFFLTKKTLHRFVCGEGACSLVAKQGRHLLRGRHL
jgi:hypothetical protein